MCFPSVYDLDTSCTSSAIVSGSWYAPGTSSTEWVPDQFIIFVDSSSSSWSSSVSYASAVALPAAKADDTAMAVISAADHDCFRGSLSKRVLQVGDNVLDA